MIKVQVSVTPNEAKLLIAKAISQMPSVCSALKNGKILLKGGTSVSAVAESLVFRKLGISGRITKLGTKSGKSSANFHRILIEGGKVKEVATDLAVEETAVRMGKGDILICGANAIDVNRRAAIMVGHPLGGTAARIIPAIMSRGVNTIIAVGWEKLIPCTIEEALAAAGRETVDLAMGMAVGLVPLWGRVITETDAVSMITGVKATMIGAGGVLGGEGSSTFIMQGEKRQVKRAWEIVQSIKGAEISGTPETLIECTPGNPRCADYLTYENKRLSVHRACVYRQPKLAKSVLSLG